MGQVAGTCWCAARVGGEGTARLRHACTREQRLQQRGQRAAEAAVLACDHVYGKLACFSACPSACSPSSLSACAPPCWLAVGPSAATFGDALSSCSDGWPLAQLSLPFSDGVFLGAASAVVGRPSMSSASLRGCCICGGCDPDESVFPGDLCTITALLAGVALSHGVGYGPTRARSWTGHLHVP